MLTEKRRRDANRKFIICSCLAIALFIGIMPAYAGAISDLIYSIIGTIITLISNLIIGILQIGINFLLGAMAVDINEIHSWGLVDGFEYFTEGIKLVGVGIASVAVIWQLFSTVFGPFVGTKQDSSVGLIFTRTLIFIPLTYIIQPLALIAFGEFQKVYNALLNVYGSHIGFWVNIQDSFNLDTFLDDMTSGNAAMEDLLAGWSAPLLAMMSTIIAAAFMILILWNMIKLVFEIMQRFVAMLVYVYLSPLATAAGVIGASEIPKKALTLFVSSGVLWVLNVWCVGIGVSLISNVGVGIAHGVTGTFVWGLVTFGFLKIAQQLDDIFNTVGATNVRLHGSILDELFSLTASGSRLTGTISKLKNGFGKDSTSKGKTPENPTTPESGVRASTNINAAAKQRQGATAKAQSSQSGPKQEAGNDHGTATNGVSIRMANGTSDQIRAVNGALNQTGDFEDKAEKLKAIHEADPDVFNKAEVKDWMGANQLGVDGETQKMLDTDFDKETGHINAVVATSMPDGSVQLSKVSGIDATEADAPHSRTSEAAKASQKMGQAQTVNDFAVERSAGDISDSAKNGSDFATFSYTDKNGIEHTAQMERISAPDAETAQFQMHLDDGQTSTINAPKDVTAQEVASMVNGTSNDKVQAAFNDYENSTHDEPGSVGHDIKNAQWITLADTEKGGTVRPGTAFENSPNTVATLSGAVGVDGLSDKVDFVRISRGEDETVGDTWNVSKNGEVIGQVNVPRDTGAAEVASRAMYDQAEDFSAVRERMGFEDNANPEISFSQSRAAIGPEPMADKRGASAEGERQDGSRWSDWSNVSVTEDSTGHPTIQMDYMRQDGFVEGAGATFTPHKATIRETGGYTLNGETVTEYTIESSVFEDGSKTFTVKGDISAEKLAAAIYSSEAAASISGAEEIRKALDINDDYSQESAARVQSLLETARRAKKGRLTSKDNPVNAN